VGRSFFLRGTADLAHHDDAVSIGVFVEQLDSINEVRANDRVTADADTGRLTQLAAGELSDGLIRECSASRHNANRALQVNMPGHDADLALAGRDDAGAIGPNEPGLSAL